MRHNALFILSDVVNSILLSPLMLLLTGVIILCAAYVPSSTPPAWTDPMLDALGVAMLGSLGLCIPAIAALVVLRRLMHQAGLRLLREDASSPSRFPSRLGAWKLKRQTDDTLLLRRSSSPIYARLAVDLALVSCLVWLFVANPPGIAMMVGFLGSMELIFHFGASVEIKRQGHQVNITTSTLIFGLPFFPKVESLDPAALREISNDPPSNDDPRQDLADIREDLGPLVDHLSPGSLGVWEALRLIRWCS